MRFSIVFALLFCAFNTALALNPEDVAAKVDPSCRQDLSDPGDIGYRLTANSQSFANQCINGVRFRPPVNMVTDGKSFVFDNYVHQGKYWHAQVDVTQVDAVYFQIVRFPVAGGLVEAAHTEIRFVLKKGSFVSLTRGTETAQSTDVLISFEAGFPVSVSYDFLMGAAKNFARVGRVLSTAQKQFENPENAIEQYDLKLSQDEKIQLFGNALSYAHKLNFVEFYNTFRPNCTTEVFDLIDALPRFKGKQGKFTTMASLDPIATPSIKGLQRRDLIKTRVQNFSDEQKGQFATLPLPPMREPFQGLLPQVAGREWALITVMPDQTTLSVTEKAALDGLREQMILALPSLMQNYTTAMVLSKDGEKGQGLFLATLKEFVKQLPAALRKINDKLPERPTPIRIYFAPDVFSPEQDTTINLGQLGLAVELPFGARKYEISETKKNAGAIFAHISKGYQAALYAGVPERPDKPFVAGLSITVNAQKDHGKVTTQVMAGLNPMENPMVNENEKVAIDKLVIAPPPKGRQHAALIITHEQDAMVEKVNDVVKADLGLADGLGTAKSPHGLGSLAVFTAYHSNCAQQDTYTPYFSGKMKNITSNGFFDFFLKGGGIEFHILGLDLKLNAQQKTVEVTTMKLALTLKPGPFTFGCINNPDAEKEFTESANKAIKDMLNKAQENPVLQQIAPLLK